MKIVDLTINIDGLRLQDNENIDDIINKIEETVDAAYPITYKINYEELINMSCFYCTKYQGIKKECKEHKLIETGSESFNCEKYEYKGDGK